MRILIADDDPVSLFVLERTLLRWGYDVIRATNGDEAWELYWSQPISLVITDWMMPKVDGLELCRRIRALNRNTYTYIILLTAKNNKSELVEGMAAGADDFISKPFDSAELEVRLQSGRRVLELESALLQSERELKAVNDQLQKNNVRQQLVNQLLGSLTSTLDFNAILEAIVEPLRLTFDASRAYIRLLDPDISQLTYASECCAADINSLGNTSFEVEQFPPEEDSLYNSKRNIEDFQHETLFNNRVSDKLLLNILGVRALLSEPLISHGRWIGEIGLHQCREARKWTDEESQLLATIANQVSIVAGNSDLYRRFQEQSVRDSLTGLFNRRYFDETLTIEVERALRYKQELALVMIDMDYLKKINDTMGHLAGDQAIKQVAGVIQSQSRKVDIATRYGGEEFAVILPQTTLAGANIAAEHWRKHINELYINGHRISASMGIASLPDQAQQPEELVKIADQALYRAKDAGRNRVFMASDEDVTQPLRTRHKVEKSPAKN